MKYLQIENVLKNIKIMLDLDLEKTDFDEKLGFLINLILDEICIFTLHKNKATLSKQLETTASDICVKYLKVNNLGIAAIQNNGAKSIKRGDTTIDFGTSNILQTMQGAGYIDAEIRLLRHFKKTRMS